MMKLMLFTSLLLTMLHASAAVQIITQPQTQEVGLGETATFIVQAVASQGELVLYQWYFNGNALPGERGTTLTITNAQTKNAGRYVVRAGNLDNYQQSVEVGLIVTLGAQSKIYPAIEVEVQTAPGGKYVMQRSRDLINWVETKDAFIGTGTPVSLLFTAREKGPTFYRALERIEGWVPFSITGMTFQFETGPSKFQIVFSGQIGGQTGTYVASGSISDRGTFAFESTPALGIIRISTEGSVTQDAIYELSFLHKTYNKHFQGRLVESGTFTH